MEALGISALDSYDQWALQKLAADPGLTYAGLRRLLQEDWRVIRILMQSHDLCSIMHESISIRAVISTLMQSS